MRKLLLPLLAVTAAPAAAQDAAVFYASDTWPVTASGRTCTMDFTGPSSLGDPLSVSYDAGAGALRLTTAGTVGSSLGSSGSMDLAIVFLENGDTDYDDGWGSRRFTFARDDGSASFTTHFTGEKNVRQILDDLSNSAHIGFLYRGEVVMSADLSGARRSLDRLRDCAARAGAAN